MHLLSSVAQRYAWGSTTAIQRILGYPVDGSVIAEAWFGAHPSAPATVVVDGAPTGLDALIAKDPAAALGPELTDRGVTTLPYLLKLIAAASPLSLQVHPSRATAAAAFAAEEAAGIPIGATHRSYRDANHKPELIYALTPFEALAGFRDPVAAAEIVEGLDAELAVQLAGVLRATPGATAVKAAFAHLLEPDTRPSPAAIAELVAACQDRLAAGSPFWAADSTVVQLAAVYPGDPGVVTSILLNRVSLQPGEALFINSGIVHAYLEGFGVEIMASSDNVLRAGLTPKHVNVAELLRNVDYQPAPPAIVDPCTVGEATTLLRAPVDDFLLSLSDVTDKGTCLVPGTGPRVLLCLDGEVTISLSDSGERVSLATGQSVFVPASDGPATATGAGRVIQADAG